MILAEQTAIFRARLRSLEKRAEASELLGEMLRGQLRRQHTELATALVMLAGPAAPAAVANENQTMQAGHL